MLVKMLVTLWHNFRQGTLFDCVLIAEEYTQQVKESNLKCFLCGDNTLGRNAWVL